MSIEFDYSVPVGVARVLDLAAQLSLVQHLHDTDDMARQDLANRIEDQADLLTRQELRVLRRAAELALEAGR